MLTNLEGDCGVRYLENGSVEVMGVTFWGTPWTPKYGGAWVLSPGVFGVLGVFWLWWLWCFWWCGFV